MAQTEFTPKVPTVAEVAHFLRSPSVLQAVHRETGIGDSWESLRGALSVETPSNTNMVVLKAEAGSPEDGVKLVETWFGLAQARYNQGTRQAIDDVVAQFEKELALNQAELRDAEEQLKSFLTNEEVEVLNQRVRSLETRLSSQYADRQRLLTSIDGLEAEMQVLSDERERIRREESSGVSLGSSILQSTIQEGLVTTRASLGSARASLEGLNASIKQTELQLAETLAELEQSLEHRSEKRYLEQMVASARARYNKLYESYSEARRAQAHHDSYLAALGDVIPSKSPIKPRTMLNTAIAGVLGVFVGVGLALFLEYFESYKTRQSSMGLTR